MPSPTKSVDAKSKSAEAMESVSEYGNPKHKVHRHRHRKQKLYESIRKQMEFYFSDVNLTKQRVMKDIIQSSEYVPITLFIEKFNKMSQISQNVDDVRRALKKSEKLELSPDETGVKRKIPFDEAKVKDEQTVENCTIYVENIPAKVDHEWIENIFQVFGQVDYVSIPKFKNTKQPKGFAFVEFQDEESCKRCLEAYGEAGGCLPTDMDPSSLKSISSFQEAEGDFSNKSNRRKRTKAEPSPEAKVKEEQNDEVVKKKLKVDDSTVTNVPKAGSSKPDKAVTKTPTDSEDLPSASEPEGMQQGVESSKSKKRKRRKKQKRKIPESEEKLESDLIHLKILPKRNWRQLRNRYLNLQRENFGKFKAQMKIARENHPLPQTSQTSTGTFKSTCVKLSLSSPAESRQEFVNQITSDIVPSDWSNLLKYVDYTEGETEAIIRLDGAPRATSGIKTFLDRAKVFFQDAKVMSEQETDEYWAESRIKLKEKKKAKIRGKDRLMNQATKFASSHIHFEETPEENENNSEKTN